jgi:hypothetical protein
MAETMMAETMMAETMMAETMMAETMMAETMLAETMLAEMLPRTGMEASLEACHGSSFARPYRSFCMTQEVGRRDRSWCFLAG